MNTSIDPQRHKPVREAAAIADTQADYLHKLAKTGELDHVQVPHGKLKKLYIDVTCPRFIKLCERNKPTDLPTTKDAPHHIDWDLWEDMAKRGEQITKKRCGDRTRKEYRRYITNFFNTYDKLNRNTLRKALNAYEDRAEPGERDYYAAQSHLFNAIMSIAKYFVFKGYEHPGLVEELRHLQPKKANKIQRRRACYNQSVVDKAIETIDTAVTKKGNKVFPEYQRALNKCFIKLAFLLGARSSELCGLRLKDISWKEKSIRLLGKGQKERYVGICDKTRQALKDYWEVRPATTCEYFLVNHKGGQLNADSWGRRLRRLRVWLAASMTTYAGPSLDGFCPHALRHTAITHMLNVDKLPLPIVRDAVGHSTIAVTNRYAQPSADDVISAMAKRG